MILNQSVHANPFYAALPRPLYAELAKKPTLPTLMEHVPLYYFSIARKLCDAVPSHEIESSSQIDIFKKKIYAILNEYKFSKTQLIAENSILKDQQFLKSVLQKTKNIEQADYFKNKNQNSIKDFELELATQITKNLTLKNIVYTTSATLLKNHHLNPRQIKTALVIMCHALDFFDTDILMNLYKSAKNNFNHFEELKNSPQNILLSSSKKIQLFFKVELNEEGILKAERKLKSSKTYSKLTINQLKYLTSTLIDAKNFYIRNTLKNIIPQNPQNKVENWVQKDIQNIAKNLGKKLDIKEETINSILQSLNVLYKRLSHASSTGQYC